MSILTLSEKVAVRNEFKAHGKDIDLTYGEAVLKDGTMLVWEGDLMQGTPVFVSTPEGVLPAPDGVHEMEDGSMIEVVEGIVQAVKTAEAPAPDAAATAAPVEQEKQTGTMDTAAAKRIVESIVKETHFSKDEVNELVNGMKAELKKEYDAKLDELKKVALEAIELMKDKPADKPVEKPKTAFQIQKEEKEAFDNRLAEHLKFLRNK